MIALLDNNFSQKCKLVIAVQLPLYSLYDKPALLSGLAAHQSDPQTRHNTFGANVVRALHVMRARADIVATKLGIILSFFFVFFLSSMHLPFSQKGFA